jgi:hypothetical protein
MPEVRLVGRWRKRKRSPSEHEGPAEADRGVVKRAVPRRESGESPVTTTGNDETRVLVVEVSGKQKSVRRILRRDPRVAARQTVHRSTARMRFGRGEDARSKGCVRRGRDLAGRKPLQR